MKDKNKKAFTIIEMLLVIFIIAIIASLVIISFEPSKRDNYDAKRLSDILQLKLALENYYLFEGEYPDNIIPGESLVGSSTGNIYLSPVPVNNPYQNISCSQNTYYYTLSVSGEYYTILFCLEGKIGGYSAGEKCLVSTSGEIIDAPCPL